MTMTEREKQIFDIICANPAIEQNEIAKQLGITRSSVAVHIANLQKKGHIMGKGYIINASPYVVGVGAANVDICGKSYQAIHMRDSNPGAMRISAGGVSRNVCENLARLGVDSRLMTAVGDDVYGDKIRNSCITAGVDVNNFYTIKGHVSSSYISILDTKGDMVVALSDMSIINHLTVDYIRAKAPLLNGARLITCDPSLPPEVMDALLDTARVPVYVDPVSTAYAATIAGKIGRFDTAKPNRLETEVLSGIKITDDRTLELACDKILEKGLRRIFVSLGQEGCFYKDCEGNCVRRSLRPLTQVANATGGGDAFMAAVIYETLNDAPIDETIDFALAAGIMAVQAETTINPELSVLNVEKIVKENKR